MKNLKKVLALVLVVVMALGLITVSNAAFTDAASIEKTEAVEVLSAIGVIGGYPDGSFKPEGEVTRAEMAKMVAVIMNKGEDVGDLYKNACKFADSANHWAAGYIAYCAQEGIISGKSETKFDPDGKVTGTEAAKMLLCALGYDADAEGFKGATWASAVLSKAAKIGLVGSDANLTVDMGAALNRDNTAQMMLNALKSDMVEYESTSTISVNGVTINNNSKASAVTKKGTQYAKIATDLVTAPDTYVVQLGEEMFKDLEKLGADNDAFGRATSKWTFDSKPVTEAPAVATMVLKDKVTGGELYTALGKIDLYAIDATTKEPVWKTHYYVDGADTTFPTNIKSGNYGEIGQIGDVIEIYKDTTAKTLDIIQINYHVAQIAQVWAAKVDANGDVTTPAYVQLKGFDDNHKLNYTENYAELSNGEKAVAANTIETAAFTAADKDAFVVYTIGNDNLIASVAKAESVTGLFSSKSSESVTIGGTKYATVDKAVKADLAMNTEATAYLDPNGNAIYVEGVASNNYAYLIAKGTTGGVNLTTEGILVFTDGTRKTVTLDTAGKTDEGAAYSYTVNADGSYKLTDNVGTDIETLAKYDANTVQVATGIKANANTVFVVETYDSAAKAAVYATYTGIANVPNITSTKYTAGWTTYTAQQAGDAVVGLTKPGDVYASVVYVFGAVTQSSSKEVTALYLTGNEEVTDDGNGTYYSVKAIVNGAETTVKVAEGATGITLPASSASLVITNNMTVDTNGYITSVGELDEKELNAAYVDFAKDTYGVYTGTYANGVIELVTSKGGKSGDAISVAETLPVYAYNTTTRTFQITTIGSYVPANSIDTLLVKLDTTVNPSVAAALYIIESNAE